MIVAGIDEAGYGSLLGPLVVSMAVFRREGGAPSWPESPGAQDLCGLWHALSPPVARRPGPGAVPVNDSKRLFQQKKGLRDLEEGLFPFLTLARGELPRDFRTFLEQVLPHRRPRPGGSLARPWAYLERYPWYRGENLEIPADTFCGLLRRLGRELSERARAARIRCVDLVAFPVEVADFNRGIRACANKAEVSFRVIGVLLRRLWEAFPEEEVELLVDRQGGRTHYAAQLFERLGPRGILIDDESEERSTYRLVRRNAARGEPPSFRVTFARESEETCLAVALASMLSKYLRELHMLLFNRYWSALDRTLKPTAGYVQDGRRFLEDTQELRKRLRIDDGLLIRQR